MADPEPASSLLQYVLAAATAIGTAIGAAFAAVKLRRATRPEPAETDLSEIKADMRILRHDMRAVQQDMVVVGNSMTQLTEILRTLAEQKVEMGYLRRDVDEMRHGEGFVLPLGASKPAR